MFSRQLRCSFCGKTADEVSKLVAGPKVYICDACAMKAVRIMDGTDSGDAHRPQTRRRTVWRRITDWILHRLSATPQPTATIASRHG